MRQTIEKRESSCIIEVTTNQLKGTLSMNSIITQKQRYLPHTLETKYHAVKTYRTGCSIKFVCRKYKVSKASLMRWNKRFDGTKASLIDRSHRPHSQHPNAHTETEIKHIKNYLKRNPTISMIELYAKLKKYKSYTRHPCSLFRLLRKLGHFKKEEIKKKKYVPKKYHTPENIGEKWQLDVKYVPTKCYVGTMPDKFYQYTMIDEASRERFIYPFKEQSSYSTIEFVKMAIKHFKYKPKIIQTDNGFEFTYFRETKRTHPFDQFCMDNDIEHKLIRPRTPRHNGKVERSHRNDNERFYQHLTFYSYRDLIEQMKRYLYRSNRLPMQVLGWLTPIDMRKKLLEVNLQ